jgi:hypothetical protein
MTEVPSKGSMARLSGSTALMMYFRSSSFLSQWWMH